MDQQRILARFKQARPLYRQSHPDVIHFAVDFMIRVYTLQRKEVVEALLHCGYRVTENQVNYMLGSGKMKHAEAVKAFTALLENDCANEAELDRYVRLPDLEPEDSFETEWQDILHRCVELKTNGLHGPLALK